VVGPDGPTHAGSFDLSYLRPIPNMVIMAPADENECRRMLCTGFYHDGPAAVRYPRGQGPGVSVATSLEPLPLGQGNIERRGKRIAFLSFGALLQEALVAGAHFDATVANMRFIKPLDETLLLDIAAKHDLLVTMEDNVVLGGAGSAVNEVLAAHQQLIPVLNLGLPDQFQDQGTREQLLTDAGLDSGAIIAAVESFLDHEPLAKHATLA